MKYFNAFKYRYIYVTLFSRVCPNAIRFANLPWREKLPLSPVNKLGWIDVGKQAFLDNFVHYTFLYFPVFYIFKNTFQSSASNNDGGGAAFGTSNALVGAMRQYQQNFWGDNMAMWTLWIPADILIYSVPLWLRLPLNHGISLAWIMILSFMRGDDKQGTDKKAKEIGSGAIS